MAIKKIKLIEGVSDMFDKNLDPAVLRDRMSQAARARDLALDAASVAENAGNTSLAAKLRKDAEDLQQILELTRQSANIHSDDELENSVHDQAQNEADTDIPSSDSEEDDLSDDAEDAPDEEPLADDEDEDEEDASSTSDEATSEEDSSENDDVAAAEDEAETEENTDSKGENGADQSSSAEEEEDAEEESGTGDTDSEDSSSSNSSDQDTSATSDVSSSESSSDDGEADGDDEDEYDESDAYGPPKVKDDLVLQDPFKNDQIDMPMPRNISDALKSGSLKLEPEIDAIIRILSSLKGEARRGAEQALKDYFDALDPLGDIYEENS